MDINQLLRSLGPVQERLQQAAAEQAEHRLEGSAGGGAVSVTLRGDLRVERVTIAPAAAAAAEGDVGMLEDLVAAALGDALRRYRERFGATPEEQLQRSMGAGGFDDLLGGLMGGLGGSGSGS